MDGGRGDRELLGVTGRREARGVVDHLELHRVGGVHVGGRRVGGADLARLGDLYGRGAEGAEVRDEVHRRTLAGDRDREGHAGVGRRLAGLDVLQLRVVHDARGRRLGHLALLDRDGERRGQLERGEGGRARVAASSEAREREALGAVGRDLDGRGLRTDRDDRVLRGVVVVRDRAGDDARGLAGLDARVRRSGHGRGLVDRGRRRVAALRLGRSLERGGRLGDDRGLQRGLGRDRDLAGARELRRGAVLRRDRDLHVDRDRRRSGSRGRGRAAGGDAGRRRGDRTGLGEPDRVGPGDVPERTVDHQVRGGLGGRAAELDVVAAELAPPGLPLGVVVELVPAPGGVLGTDDVGEPVELAVTPDVGVDEVLTLLEPDALHSPRDLVAVRHLGARELLVVARRVAVGRDERALGGGRDLGLDDTGDGGRGARLVEDGLGHGHGAGHLGGAGRGGRRRTDAEDDSCHGDEGDDRLLERAEHAALLRVGRDGHVVGRAVHCVSPFRGSHGETRGCEFVHLPVPQCRDGIATDVCISTNTAPIYRTRE